MSIKGIFCIDGPIYRDINGEYCHMNLTSEMFYRYFQVVDELTILTRIYDINTDYKEASLQKIELKNLKIVAIPDLYKLSGLRDYRNAKSIISKKVKETDLIFVRIPGEISNIVARECTKNGKKFLAEVGGCAWDSFWNHSNIGKIIAPYMYLAEKQTVKNASFASYVTEKFLQKRYPNENVSISASNVYLNETNEKTLQNRLDSLERDNSNAPYIIGTAAAVDVKYKGQEYIIKAISILNRQGYNFKYELVGGGCPTYLKQIAKKYNVEDNIEFKGMLTHQEVFKWLDTVNIYAQPSKQEGLPRALIEALSRGCISIGSETAGIPELLHPKYIFKKGNVNGIVKVLQTIIKSTEDELKKTAKINFEKSKQFDKQLLEDKRRKLYSAYLKDAYRMRGNNVKNTQRKIC